jgi:uncharacterized membrane protein
MDRLLGKLPKTIKLWHVAVSLLIIANALYFVRNPWSDIATLSYFLFIPGYLLLANLGHRNKSPWLTLSFALGLSILLMMLGGLLINGLHYIGLDRPLSTLSTFALLDILVVSLLIPLRHVALAIPKMFRRPNTESIIVVTVLSLLPLLAAGGAIRLNNGGTNILTMLLFAAVFAIFMVLIWRQKKLGQLYPYAIFTMGLAVLFATSLRGWSITGHDIHHEFQVFQTVLHSGFWDASPAIKDPYNACLSITMLPTMLANISSISAAFIYKIIFQILFAISLVAVYLFAKRLSGQRVALIAAFIFISFPPFLNDMAFLNRQEIAFLFFSLLLLANFTVMSRRLKTVLTVAFLLGLILSHYSSGYVTLGILLFAWACYKLLTYRIQTKADFLPILSLPIIASALLFTFLWNTQITATSPGLEKAIKTLTEGSSDQSSGISYSLFSGGKPLSAQTKLAEYAGDKSAAVTYLPEKNLPETRLGQAMDSIVEPNTFNGFIRSSSAKFLQILLFIGAIIMFVRYRRKTLKQPTYYYALVVACIALLGCMILFPQLSADYSVTRLFQQTLVIIALPMVFALLWILSRVKKIRYNVAALVFGLMFLHLSGFVPQLIGGYPPQMALNNDGIYHDIYYDHKGEVVSSRWLAARDDGQIIAADPYAKMQFPNYPLQKERVFNPLKTDDRESYLFHDYANVQKGVYTSFIGGDVIQYTYDDNHERRPLFYSNPVSKVYGSDHAN